jgi:predicted Zn-dependent protease
MEERFQKYLSAIGISDVLSNRIEEIYKFYDEIILKDLIDKIEDIFVTDYILNNGSRQYENVWFFTKRYVMEAKLFSKEDDFDISPLIKQVDFIDIKKHNYEFGKATEESRLSIIYASSLNTNQGDLRASKGNCDYLMKITLKYLIPNLVT